MPNTLEGPLTQLQKKMDELGVMFYTYVGIMQRDAPPIARGPEDIKEAEADESKRQEQATRAPQYARDIVRTSKEIDKLIGELEGTIQLNEDVQNERIREEDMKSREAGQNLSDKTTMAEELLGKVREALKEIDEDDDEIGR